MNKELALELTKQADEIQAKITQIEQKMFFSFPAISDDEYDALEKEKKPLNKECLRLRNQALAATL